MRRTPRGLFAGTMLTMWLGVVASASTDVGPTLHIHGIDRIDIPHEILNEAIRDVARIYGRIGVRVQWSGQHSGDSAETLHVIIATTDRWHLQPGIMGIALMGNAPVGRTVYAFYDRILETANSHRLTVGSVLGNTIAHEIGHLLLPRGHTMDGLMREDWDWTQIDSLRAGVLGFSRGQGAQIRARLLELERTP
jgi:hypothetical protein